MKARCPIHNRTLRWLPSKQAWICRIRPCETIDDTSPAPKVKQIKKRLRTIYRDGREVLRGAAWQTRKVEVWELDKGQCQDCGISVNAPVEGQYLAAKTHHVFRRGMAGSWRNDRIWITIDGKQIRNLLTLCAACHAKARPEPKWSRDG